MIQKFGTEEKGQSFEKISDRDDIIVITDEAHRTQYGTLAMNMREALPNAKFIAFTGTPLMKNDEKTKLVFGDYVSKYTFKQSIEDHATVPLYYEARIPRMQLTNDELEEDLQNIIDSADFTPEQEEQFEKEYVNMYQVITREDRLDAIAKDFDTLNKMGRGFNNYTFDFKNPNNFVLVGNTLRITDEISSTCIKNPNSIAEMLSVFLEKMNIETFAPYSDGAVPARRQLLRKIILAGMKCNLDFGDCPADKIIWNNIIENLCNLKVSSGSVMNTLKSMRKIVPEQKLRLKLTSDYLDNILSK